MSRRRALQSIVQTRHFAADFGRFHVKNLKFVHTPAPRPIPKETPAFGTVATDHMLEVDFKNGAWQAPVIRLVEDLPMTPSPGEIKEKGSEIRDQRSRIRDQILISRLTIDSLKVLHYCPTIFEGLKAFRGVDNEIRMFRTEANMACMVTSARRAALPDFCPLQLEHMTEDLVRKEQEWIPRGEGTSLYLQTFIMGTDPSLAMLVVICCPFGPYYASEWQPIKPYANPAHIRVAPGGVGAFKMGW